MLGITKDFNIHNRFDNPNATGFYYRCSAALLKEFDSMVKESIREARKQKLFHNQGKEIESFDYECYNEKQPIWLTAYIVAPILIGAISGCIGRKIKSCWQTRNNSGSGETETTPVQVLGPNVVTKH